MRFSSILFSISLQHLSFDCFFSCILISFFRLWNFWNIILRKKCAKRECVINTQYKMLIYCLLYTLIFGRAFICYIYMCHHYPFSNCLILLLFIRILLVWARNRKKGVVVELSFVRPNTFLSCFVLILFCFYLGLSLFCVINIRINVVNGCLL